MEDFYLYVSHLHDFQNTELTEDISADKAYPVGILHYSGVGSVKLKFHHYTSFKEARDKWIERSQRIRFDRICLVVCFTKENSELVKKIDMLPFPKMLITNERHMDIGNEYVLDYDTPGELFSAKGNGPARHLEDIDYVSFLNNTFSAVSL